MKYLKLNYILFGLRFSILGYVEMQKKKGT